MQMKTSSEIRSSFDDINAVTDTMKSLREDGNATVQLTVAEEDIGKFWGIVRRNDLDPTTKRLGDTLVARFDAEPSLGDLFR
jgi:hypothetical protein